MSWHRFDSTQTEEVGYFMTIERTIQPTQQTNSNKLTKPLLQAIIDYVNHNWYEIIKLVQSPITHKML